MNQNMLNDTINVMLIFGVIIQVTTMICVLYVIRKIHKDNDTFLNMMYAELESIHTRSLNKQSTEKKNVQ